MATSTTNINDRVKPLFITDNDSEERYELDFNRDAVRFAEQRKFNISEVGDYPNTLIPELFFYSFRMHHKNISRQRTDKILEELGGLTPAMLERLVYLYDQARMSNALQTDEDLEKNSRMTVEMD